MHTLNQFVGSAARGRRKMKDKHDTDDCTGMPFVLTVCGWLDKSFKHCIEMQTSEEAV